MNFLAHLFLADDSPESRLGNLAGDFVKGTLGDRFPPAIREGIRMHRRIDAFTDSHAEVSAMRRLLFAEQGHYARIVVDLFLDHFLAVSFSSHASRTLESFVAQVHDELDERIDEMPGMLRHVYPRMRDEGWLMSYQRVDGIAVALTRISGRIARRPDLGAAARHLRHDRETYEKASSVFLDDVIAYAERLRGGR